MEEIPLIRKSLFSDSSLITVPLKPGLKVFLIRSGIFFVKNRALSLYVCYNYDGSVRFVDHVSIRNFL